jgi:hypothetical protein
MKGQGMAHLQGNLDVITEMAEKDSEIFRNVYHASGSHFLDIFHANKAIFS